MDPLGNSLLHPGSPFILPFSQNSLESLKSELHSNEYVVALSGKLQNRFIGHTEILMHDSEVARKYKATAMDILSYKKGAIASFSLVIVVYFQVNNLVNKVNSELNRWIDIDNGRFSEFLKNSSTRAAFLIQNQKNKDFPTGIFHLLIEYEQSPFYEAGILIAENIYMLCMHYLTRETRFHTGPKIY